MDFLRVCSYGLTTAILANGLYLETRLAVSPYRVQQMISLAPISKAVWQAEWTIASGISPPIVIGLKEPR